MRLSKSIIIVILLCFVTFVIAFNITDGIAAMPQSNLATMGTIDNAGLLLAVDNRFQLNDFIKNVRDVLSKWAVVWFVVLVTVDCKFKRYLNFAINRFKILLFSIFYRLSRNGSNFAKSETPLTEFFRGVIRRKNSKGEIRCLKPSL